MNKPADASGAALSFRREKWLAGTSGVLIPFRRAAKRSSALCHPRCPCSSSQIRSPGAKRKYSILCFEALINCVWGAKRARSALGAGRSGSNKRCVLEVYSRRQPYRGPKRARSGLGGSGGETGLSWQSLPPLPPDNRCLRLLHFRRLASWGAKRSRSALGGGRKPSLSVRSLPCPNNSSSSCTRDWANLGDGPAGLIAELALTSDVADYVRFRAVCKPWRQCSPDPRVGGLDVRFLPRRWIMFDKGSCHHRFLNVSTGECIWMSLPELLEGEHRFLEVTPEGLLLLLHKPTMIARLLNPLTRQLIDLPPLTAFVEGGDCSEPEEQGPFVEAVGLTEDSTVVVAFCYSMGLAFAKPGDDSWTVVNDGFIHSAVAFAGRFYCAINRGIMVLNTTTCSDQQQQAPRLTMVADLEKSFICFSEMMHTLHLVDNGGELMLVRRPNGQDKHKQYNVYRVDLETGIFIPVKRLNGHAMFLGMLRTISVSVEAFPYVTTDTIYLGYECDMDIEEYNIADGSRHNQIRIYDGSVYDGWVSPATIVQTLINCIQDPDIVNQIF